VQRKVNIQYLQANEEKARAAVTEAEITQRYEQDPKIYARDKEEFEKQEKEDRADREREDAAIKKLDEGKKSDAEKKPDSEKKPDTGKKPDTEKKPSAEVKPQTPKTE